MIRGKELMLWPVHCVQETHGAAIHKSVEASSRDTQIVRKAFDPQVECLSAFRDMFGEVETDLPAILKKRGITSVYVGGLAFDYCVLHTIMDALEYGYSVTLICDATKAVSESSGQAALDKIKDRIECIDTIDLLSRL